MKIEFDPTKDAINKVKHGISLAMAEFLDWNTAIVEPDNRFEYGELRFIGLSPLDGRIYTVIFTYRNPNIRIISLRKSNKKEVNKYVSHYERR